jgi:subtilisin family serine protease
VEQPDITAPGVHILAATSPHNPSMDGEYAMLSGTSMSTPHISGIVALIKALHPNWSPAAVKSALITTGIPMLIPFIIIFFIGSIQFTRRYIILEYKLNN